MLWKYNITVNIDPRSRNQGVKLCRDYLLAPWLLLVEQPVWKLLRAVPKDQCFLHTLLPCIVMSTNINTRVSVHTWPAYMLHIVSFQPFVVSGCSKPAAKSTSTIKLQQLQYPPLTVQQSSLAGQTNQCTGLLFFMGRVWWAVDGWPETTGSLLQASWATSLMKSHVVCLQRWFQIWVIGWEEKSPATSRCAGSVRSSVLCLPPPSSPPQLPGCLGRRKMWCSPFPHVPSHTPVNLAVFAVSVMALQWSCEWKFGSLILQLSVFPEAAQNLIN